MNFIRPDIVRPPSEHASYYLPLTSGCSNNTCTFCMSYGVKLHVRDIAEVKQEIDAVALFLEHEIRLPNIPDVVYYIARQWDGQHVFLLDGDALVYPFPKLLEVLQYLKQKLPTVDRVAAYATAKDVLRLSVEQLQELKKVNLKLLFVGLESGDSEILEKIGKNTSPEEMVAAGQRVKRAGITLSVTVLLGIGGIEKSERHAIATAKVLSGMDPDFAGALTVTLVPGTPLHTQWQKGEFTLVDPFQSLVELKLMVENLNLSDCFFSSMHASNYLSIRGKLPPDKSKMLKQIEQVLKKHDAAMLRPEYLRGL
jgi:radical SAM superfamily enzyme YgiQ (UPF0313 family)